MTDSKALLDLRENLRAAIKTEKGRVINWTNTLDRLEAVVATHTQSILDDLEKQAVFVTYKADNGHGVAVSVEALQKKREEYRNGGL